MREADKVRYGRQAEREGKSLGAWLREAAEPDWEEHRTVIERSQRSGNEPS